MRLFIFIGALCFFSTDLLKAQEILTVANNPMEEIFRRKQLIAGFGDSSLATYSFMVRPVTLPGAEAISNTSAEGATNFASDKKRFSFSLLPFQYIQQFNDKRTHAYADGSMFPARGWQFNYTIGAEARYKNFLVRLRPEYTWAFNAHYPTFSTDHYNIIWKYYYQWLNKMDAPELFKDEPIKKVFAGQSRIQYAYKGMALGVSTENLWWGPGRFNSLVMSNNAPGFLHYTFHSDAPLQTPVGSVEWQVVWGGKLNASGTLPQERGRTYNGMHHYQPKDSIHQRVFSGGVLSWQPKWIKGLFLGMDAASVHYKGAGLKPAQMGSLFARFVLPEEKAEIYFQYGRSDKFATALNLLGDTIPRGYLAGVRKLFPLSKKAANNSYLQLGIEITQLQVPNISLIRQTQSWYTDDQVRHGFTHEGQVLGAPIGAGSNAQRIDLSWVKGKLRLGLEFERWLHNADFYYNYNVNTGSLDFNRQWIDLMSSLVWSVPIKKIQWFGQFSAVRSINYQWKSYIPIPVTAETYFDDGWDEINLHGRTGLLWNISGKKPKLQQ